ncbi:hypothetical protein JMM81_10020 [Bacillus sp. V3B]|nr:hypothetical protein [Bacillus sp. V3B]MCQ6275300.1 hypothetical protein [Bacillus sp. V3B]
MLVELVFYSVMLKPTKDHWRDSAMDELMKLLDDNLICTGTDISTDFIHFYVKSTEKNVRVLFVKQYLPESTLAINGAFKICLFKKDKKVLITLSNRKMFCDNPVCDRTTFAESFSFIDNKAKKNKTIKRSNHRNFTDTKFYVSCNLSNATCSRY